MFAVQKFTYPFEHLIIDDFFPDHLIDKILRLHNNITRVNKIEDSEIVDYSQAWLYVWHARRTCKEKSQYSCFYSTQVCQRNILIQRKQGTCKTNYLETQQGIYIFWHTQRNLA